MCRSRSDSRPRPAIIGLIVATTIVGLALYVSGCRRLQACTFGVQDFSKRPLGADVGCRRRTEPPGQPSATVISRIAGRGLREVNLRHPVPRPLRFQPQVAAAGGDEVDKDAKVDSG